MSAPFVLVPISITDAMLTSSTAAEPGPGEALWNAATSYVVGQEAILTSTHRVYTNQVAGVDATPPNLALSGSTPRWKDTRATNKWACWDFRKSNQSAVVTPFTQVIRPGIFNAIKVYGLDGATLSVTVKDSPGGSVIFTTTVDLQELPIDHYDYYFGRIKTISKVLCSGITPFEDPEVTISITAGTGVTVKAGVIAIGDLRTLISVDGTGGTQWGASARPVSNSYVSLDSAGYNSINNGAKGTDMDIRIQVPIEDVNAALATLQDVLDIPASFVGSDVPSLTGLDAFGLASGSVTYEGPSYAVISVQVKGIF